MRVKHGVQGVPVMTSGTWEFRETWLGDSHSLPKDINEFSHVTSTSLERYGWNSVQNISASCRWAMWVL